MSTMATPTEEIASDAADIRALAEAILKLAESVTAEPDGHINHVAGVAGFLKGILPATRENRRRLAYGAASDGKEPE